MDTAATTPHHVRYEGQPVGPIILDESIDRIQMRMDVFEDPDARISLDESLRIVIDWTENSTGLQLGLITEDVKVSFAGSRDPEGFFVIRHNSDLVAGKRNYQAVPFREPILLSGAPATRGSGLIVNGPHLLTSKGTGLSFTIGEFEIRIEAFLTRTSSLRGGVRPTLRRLLRTTFLLWQANKARSIPNTRSTPSDG